MGVMPEIKFHTPSCPSPRQVTIAAKGCRFTQLTNARYLQSSGITPIDHRREILDWYHLVENLGKVGGSQRRLDKVEALLWKGDVDGAIEQFNGWQHERVTRFIGYLNKHRGRIINYDYWQAEGISIGSGAIESTVKQIGLRIKITGAQWKEKNVPQVLKQRCAYLNGTFSS